MGYRNPIQRSPIRKHDGRNIALPPTGAIVDVGTGFAASGLREAGFEVIAVEPHVDGTLIAHRAWSGACGLRWLRRYRLRTVQHSGSRPVRCYRAHAGGAEGAKAVSPSALHPAGWRAILGPAN
jgi:hypothetical protein